MILDDNSYMRGDCKKVLIIGLILFLLSSTTYYKNSVCCMFSATRSYGFPGQFLILNKTTDSYDEAKKIEHVDGFNLLKNGWKLRFAASIESPVSASAHVNLIVNVFFWLLIGWFLVF